MDDVRPCDAAGTGQLGSTGGAPVWQLAEERRLLMEAVRAGIRLTAAEQRRLDELGSRPAIVPAGRTRPNAMRMSRHV